MGSRGRFGIWNGWRGTGLQSWAIACTAAFARARELTAGIEAAADPFSIYYGLWVGNFVRGELAPMRDIAEIIKGEVEVRPGSPEAGVAARLNGTTDWFAGILQMRAFRSNARSRSLIIRSAIATLPFDLPRTSVFP